MAKQAGKIFVSSHMRAAPKRQTTSAPPSDPNTLRAKKYDDDGGDGEDEGSEVYDDVDIDKLRGLVQGKVGRCNDAKSLRACLLALGQGDADMEAHGECKCQHFSEGQLRDDEECRLFAYHQVFSEHLNRLGLSQADLIRGYRREKQRRPELTASQYCSIDFPC
jgi:hypothetical protein